MSVRMPGKSGLAHNTLFLKVQCRDSRKIQLKQRVHGNPSYLSKVIGMSRDQFCFDSDAGLGSWRVELQKLIPINKPSIIPLLINCRVVGTQPNATFSQCCRLKV